jgi:hypothetical protein
MSEKDQQQENRTADGMSLAEVLLREIEVVDVHVLHGHAEQRQVATRQQPRRRAVRRHGLVVLSLCENKKKNNVSR